MQSELWHFGAHLFTISKLNIPRSFCRQNHDIWDKFVHTMKSQYSNLILQTELWHLGQICSHFKISILQAHFADRIMTFGTHLFTLLNLNNLTLFCRLNSDICDNFFTILNFDKSKNKKPCFKWMHVAAGRPRGFWPRQAPYLISYENSATYEHFQYFKLNQLRKSRTIKIGHFWP